MVIIESPVSAASKRSDQQRMSLPEYKKLEGHKTFNKFVDMTEKHVLAVFALDYGPLALKRLETQARVEGISAYTKLRRLVAKSKE